jgi:hypothetical protein
MTVSTAHLKIRGKRWKIRFAPVPNDPTLYGLCDYDTRTIWVHPNKEPKGTLIHEVLHACHVDMTELAVDETERAITKALELL